MPIKTRADLMNLDGFSGLDIDSAGNPCVWRNFYSCSCAEWSMDWSCKCNDRCPSCDAEVEAYRSDWIGPTNEGDRTLWRELPEAV